jgi:hypothetical protein
MENTFLLSLTTRCVFVQHPSAIILPSSSLDHEIDFACNPTLLSNTHHPPSSLLQAYHEIDFLLVTQLF